MRHLPSSTFLGRVGPETTPSEALLELERLLRLNIDGSSWVGVIFDIYYRPRSLR